MPTKNPRLNVVLDPNVYNALHRMSHREGISLSLVARDLIRESLELHEDVYWDETAQKREVSFNRKNALSHKDVWSK